MKNKLTEPWLELKFTDGYAVSILIGLLLNIISLSILILIIQKDYTHPRQKCEKQCIKHDCSDGTFICREYVDYKCVKNCIDDMKLLKEE